MSLDFTVVVRVRQRFGDGSSDDIGQETSAPFVGREKSYEFACPGVDPDQPAVVLFQCQGANRQNSVSINGHNISGGIARSVDQTVVQFPSGDIMDLAVALWNGNVMLVSESVLQETNTLRIRANIIDGTDNVDNFIIDNVVVLFKTRRSAPIVS